MVAIPETTEYALIRSRQKKTAHQRLTEPNIEYEAFGSPYAANTVEAVSNRYTYTGREKSSVGAPMFYRWRQFDPALGLFMQRDPAATPEDNLYGYVGNRPVQWVDSYGLEACVSVLIGWKKNQGTFVRKGKIKPEDDTVKICIDVEQLCCTHSRKSTPTSSSLRIRLCNRVTKGPYVVGKNPRVTWRESGKDTASLADNNGMFIGFNKHVATISIYESKIIRRCGADIDCKSRDNDEVSFKVKVDYVPASKNYSKPPGSVMPDVPIGSKPSRELGPFTLSDDTYIFP